MRHSRCTASLVLVALGFVGCGTSDQADVERQQLTEQRIRQERADAARQARQEERIKQLEREARRRSRTPTKTTTVQVPVAEGGGTTTPSATSGDDWPGGSGFTVVLASEGSQGAARATQRRASDAGLDAGVLNSSDYSSLRSGYWVVFSGKFDSQAQAASRQSRARQLGFSDAYARFVSR